MERNTPAVLGMSLAKVKIRDNAFNGCSPEDNLDITNNMIASNNIPPLFLRVLLLHYDKPNQKVRFASAAGVSPILIKKDGCTFVDQSKEYMPLGAWEDTEYELTEIDVESGDVLVLYNRHAEDDTTVRSNIKLSYMAEIVTDALKNHPLNVTDTIMERARKEISIDEFEYSLIIIRIK